MKVSTLPEKEYYNYPNFRGNFLIKFGIKDQTSLTIVEKYCLNRENLTKNLLLTNFYQFYPPKSKGHKWTICIEGGGTSPPAGGSVIPWAPVLQIEAIIYFANIFFCLFKNRRGYLTASGRLGDPLGTSPANKRCHSPDGEWCF